MCSDTALPMTSLRTEIIKRIRSEGPISFETFMEWALYFPGRGYYTRDVKTIGREGDFYTGTHLHPIFGAMLGRQMEEMWDAMGHPKVFQVVEMGAGMGYLARDMMDFLRGRQKVSKLYHHLTYTIVEMNPSMEARQRALLRECEGRMRWCSHPDELKPFAGCLVSNELLDAFPVRVIEMDDELTEVFLSVNGEDLKEMKRPCGSEIKDYFREISIELPKGYRTEVNLRMRGWLKEVNEVLSEGFVLTIDYGYPAWEYYGEERNRGTLLCYRAHQVCEDPYQNIGDQDITAHVNFTSLKKWGEELGFKTLGYCPQGTYLISLGIDEVITELYGDSPDPFDIARIRGLIFPQGMGESHKVMILYKGKGNPGLRGFALRNQVRNL